jgi:CheY-like chemotaxis protein
LVRGLIELHNGRVFANSSGLGKGSEFVFCLPLVAAPAEKPSPSTAPSASERPLRILVIDDGRDTVITMRALLRKLGHEVETASDGERGLEIAEQTCPDVVISDIGLPGIDGYEVARQIRQHPQLRDKFLVAVTGYGQDEDRRRAAEAGFNEHLTKPIDLRDLRRFLSGVSPRASR